MFRRTLSFVLFIFCVTESLSLTHVSRRKMFKTAAIVSSSFALNLDGASAYPRRDVGDENRSAATAAMNDQAYRTNNRLEQQGFKLDTPEEEQARLSSAMSSFSYDDATTKKKGSKSKSSSKSNSK